MDGFDDIAILFDATSAKAHIASAAKLAPLGKQLIDLTPAAIGLYAVPAVNLEQHLDAPNISMLTCNGQATIPIVAAIVDVALDLAGIRPDPPRDPELIRPHAIRSSWPRGPA